jgi:hypothetical protein
VGYAYLPKVRGQDATHWRRRVLDMKILAYIYLFDILLKITSPQAHCEGMKDNRIAIAIKLTGMG